MSGAGARDPIAAWRDVSARAARATGARTRDLRPAARPGSLRAAATTSAGLLTLAAVVIAVTLAIRPGAAPASSHAVIAVSPRPSEAVEASPTIDPSAIVPSDGPAESSTSDDLFDLTLSVPRSWYTPGDAIEPFALLRYRGPDAKVNVGHADPYLFFTIEEVDGDRQMTGGAADSCTITTFSRDAAVGIPFSKSGQTGLGFDEAWFRDPVLRLPPGTWRISARFEADLPACESGSAQHLLTASIEITVIAGP